MHPSYLLCYNYLVCHRVDACLPIPLVTTRYPSPVYIPSGSNGFVPNGTSEGLPRAGSQSPEARISFDSPKFKLTQERALPLVRWYEDHKDHPYPSRQEKLHLCQTTQLTYTQVRISCIVCACVRVALHPS